MPKRTSATHPKLWRKSRGEKDYGCFYVTIAGKDVNLGSQNAELCRSRLPEALKGRRSWPSDAHLAAVAMEPTSEQLATAPPTTTPTDPPADPPPSSEPIAAPTPTPLAPSSPPVDPPAPPELPEPAPTSEENARAEADATNAAAAGTGGATDGDDAQAGATAAVEPDAIFPPGGLDGLLTELARALVLLQVDVLQPWLIKKRTGKIAAPIPGGSKIHEMAEAAWLEQFKTWYPDISNVPPALLAVGLPLIFVFPQMKGATDPPTQNGHNPTQPTSSSSTPAPAPPRSTSPEVPPGTPAIIPGAIVVVS